MAEENIEEQVEQQEVEAKPVDVDGRLATDDKKAKNKPKAKTLKLSGKKLVEELHKKVAALEEDKKELQHDVLKKRAEFDNFRKRLEQQKDDFIKYSLERFIKDLLPILDSFNMALHPDNLSEEQQQMFEGFGLIYKQALDLLSKNSVIEIEAVGKDFDPNLHQAVSQEESAEAESGKVIREYQKGYKLHDRVIRPSMVVVSA